MDKLETLWAIEQIKQLKARYIRFADTRRLDDLLGVFTEDVVWTLYDDDNVTILRQLKSRDEFAAYMRSTNGPRLAGFSAHAGYLPEIEIIDESHARGIWAMRDYVHHPGDKHFLGYGHYTEEYRRQPDGEWLVSASSVTRLHVEHFDHDPNGPNGELGDAAGER
jgi:hypothetical protein